MKKNLKIKLFWEEEEEDAETLKQQRQHDELFNSPSEENEEFHPSRRNPHMSNCNSNVLVCAMNDVQSYHPNFRPSSQSTISSMSSTMNNENDEGGNDLDHQLATISPMDALLLCFGTEVCFLWTDDTTPLLHASNKGGTCSSFPPQNGGPNPSSASIQQYILVARNPAQLDEILMHYRCFYCLSRREVAEEILGREISFAKQFSSPSYSKTTTKKWGNDDFDQDEEYDDDALEATIRAQKLEFLMQGNDPVRPGSHYTFLAMLEETLLVLEGFVEPPAGAKVPKAVLQQKEKMQRRMREGRAFRLPFLSSYGSITF